MPLKIHFLNVGRGDCTIVEFPSGHVGVIDIDNLKVLDPDSRNELLEAYRETRDYLLRKHLGTPSWRLEEEFLRKKAEELTDPLSYYDTHIGSGRSIFRLLVTHPDMDHMTGLYRLHMQDTRKEIVNFWHTGLHEFNLANTTAEEWEQSPYDRRDWETYKLLRNSTDSPKALQKYQGAEGEYWTEDGLELWAPTAELEQCAVEKEQANILSMVVKISYQGRSILLGGDATAEKTWPAIMDQVGKVDVLKASHHGRKTGYYSPAVKAMAPWLTITSVGQKAYDATDSYRRYSTYTVSLRDAGDVCIEIGDDGILRYPFHLEEHWKPKHE